MATGSESETEIAALVSYRCDCCQATLQAPVPRSTAWLRCPFCGKGGLPPEPASRKWSMASPIKEREDALVIGPPRELSPMTPVAVAGGNPVGASRVADQPALGWPDHDEGTGNGARVAFASVLFIALTLLLFASLDQSFIGTSITGAVAVVSLLLLLVKSRPRHSD